MSYSRSITHDLTDWTFTMTVLMTFVGTLVFIFSLFTVGFKSAVKRLWVFVLTGVAIDALIVGLAITVGIVSTYF